MCHSGYVKNVSTVYNLVFSWNRRLPEFDQRGPFEKETDFLFSRSILNTLIGLDLTRRKEKAHPLRLIFRTCDCLNVRAWTGFAPCALEGSLWNVIISQLYLTFWLKNIPKPVFPPIQQPIIFVRQPSKLVIFGSPL